MCVQYSTIPVQSCRHQGHTVAHQQLRVINAKGAAGPGWGGVRRTAIAVAATASIHSFLMLRAGCGLLLFVFIISIISRCWRSGSSCRHDRWPFSAVAVCGGGGCAGAAGGCHGMLVGVCTPRPY